jgi:hypothetical protein
MNVQICFKDWTETKFDAIPSDLRAASLSKPQANKHNNRFTRNTASTCYYGHSIRHDLHSLALFLYFQSTTALLYI